MGTRRTLLVIEDDHDLREFFRLTLTVAGYDVVQAANGIEGLQRLDEALPDLVILDLRLPGVNGREVLTELSSQAHTRAIPVVIVTASDANLDFANIRCWLRKPVRPERLLETVQQCLS